MASSGPSRPRYRSGPATLARPRRAPGAAGRGVPGRRPFAPSRSASLAGDARTLISVIGAGHGQRLRRCRARRCREMRLLAPEVSAAARAAPPALAEAAVSTRATAASSPGGEEEPSRAGARSWSPWSADVSDHGPDGRPGRLPLSAHELAEVVASISTEDFSVRFRDRAPERPCRRPSTMPMLPLHVVPELGHLDDPSHVPPSIGRHRCGSRPERAAQP
jgi:hypothetical protein